jgi:hypothetical protein
MNRTVLILAGALLAGIGLWRILGTKLQGFAPVEGELEHPHNIGKDVIAQLRKQGSDLLRPHSMEFYFYFPTQAGAEQAAGDLRAKGFWVKTDRAAVRDQWLCLASRRLVPDERTLDQWGQWFERVAATHGGEYDGWEASVEKK